MRFITLSLCFVTLMNHINAAQPTSGSNSDFSNHWAGVATGFVIPPEWAIVSGIANAPPGWADLDPNTATPCTKWFVDRTSAGCCADTGSSSYGHCHSSTEHNCPGINAKSTCNVANNKGDTGSQGSCPWQTPGSSPVYPLCAPVSSHCSRATINDRGSHCWGILRCYATEQPGENDSPVPCGTNTLYSKGGDFQYFENSFCFETGSADNTKWCGVSTCKSPDTYNPDTQVCCSASLSPADLAVCTCPGGGLSPDGTQCCALFPETSAEYRACKGFNVVRGDPQFGGFQGQDFQFHGLADEVFNLISTPKLQLNGHFVYLSSGKCDYNNTVCFQHPGTYVDQLGFAFQGRQITLVAGPHAQGMSIHINGDMISHRGRFTFTGTDGQIVNVHVESHDRVVVRTEEFIITVVNSDMFFNLETAMLDHKLLRLGSPRHTITDRTLCQQEAEVDATKFEHLKHGHNATDIEHNHGQVEAALQKKYGGVQVPVHGLIGQTWRNAVVCGKNWVGSVTDYVASNLFASDYMFNFYTKN